MLPHHLTRPPERAPVGKVTGVEACSVTSLGERCPASTVPQSISHVLISFLSLLPSPHIGQRRKSSFSLSPSPPALPSIACLFLMPLCSSRSIPMLLLVCFGAADPQAVSPASCSIASLGLVQLPSPMSTLSSLPSQAVSSSERRLRCLQQCRKTTITRCFSLELLIITVPYYVSSFITKIQSSAALTRLLIMLTGLHRDQIFKFFVRCKLNLFLCIGVG